MFVVLLVIDPTSHELGSPAKQGRFRYSHPAIAQSWRRNWEQVIPFFAYPADVRRILYTTCGDRAANSALHIIAICRLRCDGRTQKYVARRIADGLSKLEAIRCVKRYIAREVFSLIRARYAEINQAQIAT